MSIIYEEKYWDERKWHDFCQECLKNKFIDHGYQCVSYEESLEFGYIGFNNLGKVFISICSDVEQAQDEGYLKQIIKEKIYKIIDSERGKLLFYNRFLITDIIIISPSNLDADIKIYCRDIANELKTKQINFIESNFQVTFWDIEFFSKEIPTIIKSKDFLYDFRRGKITEKEIEEFLQSNSMYTNNLESKLQMLLKEKEAEDELEDFKVMYIMNYFQGKFMIDDLAENFETLYTELMEIIRINEEAIRRKSLKKQVDKFTYLDDITEELRQELINQYSKTFHNNDIQELNNYVISDWLMRCPLNFR